MPLALQRHGKTANRQVAPCLCRATGMARSRACGNASNELPQCVPCLWLCRGMGKPRTDKSHHACAEPQAWHEAEPAEMRRMNFRSTCHASGFAEAWENREPTSRTMPVQSHRHGTKPSLRKCVE